MVAFENGLCSARCASDSECGACAECVPYVVAGRARLRGPLLGGGVCRQRCDAAARACAEHEQCDDDEGACVEGCIDDAQCAFRTVDSDGDGREDLLVHERDEQMRCVERRCRSVAPAGAPCLADDECTEDQRCTRGAGWDPLRPGRCETGDCALCAHDEVCPSRASRCVAPCVVGADPPDAITGTDGHGAGCAPGFRCEPRIPAVPDDPRAGVCIPGTYNDVAAPNLEMPCARDAECFSPYGRGACVAQYAGGPRSCTVVTCISDGSGLVGFAPDVEVDPAIWCDPAAGLSCDDGRCVRACVDAEDCMPGAACVLWRGETLRFCGPECVTEYDCRASERCNAADGSRCTVGDRPCRCGPR